MRCVKLSASALWQAPAWPRAKLIEELHDQLADVSGAFGVKAPSARGQDAG